MRHDYIFKTVVAGLEAYLQHSLITLGAIIFDAQDQSKHDELRRQLARVEQIQSLLKHKEQVAVLASKLCDSKGVFKNGLP